MAEYISQMNIDHLEYLPLEKTLKGVWNETVSGLLYTKLDIVGKTETKRFNHIIHYSISRTSIFESECGKYTAIILLEK